MAQSEKNNLHLRDFRPKPKLERQKSIIHKPRFHVIDSHIHLSSSFGGSWRTKPLEQLIERMDHTGVTKMVDLDGGWGEDILDSNLAYFKEKSPERFVHFGGVDWSQWQKHENNFGTWASERLKAQVQRGAEGLKIWKPFGLQVKDQNGKLVTVNDERLDILWQSAAELNIPVLMHVADPVAFFDPLDSSNERWEELIEHPDWHFPSTSFPSFETIIEDFARLIRRHKYTTFIGAHVGCYAENLAWLSELMNECPNLYVDISARLGELGRQPYSARKFFLKHADKILFGTDADASIETYQLYYRFLETDDEYFSYNTSDPPKQGRWFIYGLHLPDDVLKKVYHQNAKKLF